jgi:hypothetical protein
VVGMGLLRLIDPMPMTYPLVKALPVDGQLVIEIRQGANAMKSHPFQTPVH